ncbi:MAG: guanylate kinase [Clostridiales bacterium]|nr:guanylate kinase [Clostridiales bacterium]MDD6389688.1 guanylate kinase [Bacillota bacterium]MDY5975967.1 guanylate kinase [Anaerovoracaceae bacterium]
MNKGKLLVISGPSGVGKGTICKRIAEDLDVDVSVSMTTRKPRDGEEEGVSYYFVTHDEFQAEIARDGLLEYAQRYENYYGTPKARIIENLESGRDVILEIEMEGALKAKKAVPGAVLIFILPPSLAELRRRLEGRGTETKEAIEMRLSDTVGEIEYITGYDYAVVNDNIEQAVADVEKIIAAEHMSTRGCAQQIIDKYKEELQL